MTVDEQVEMTTAEVTEFLTGRQVAVLALPRPKGTYCIPVTYRYDADGRRFYFRMVFAEGSTKRRFFDERPRAQLVVYEEAPPRYRSVIAEGRPRRITNEEIDLEYVEAFGEMMRPLFELWREDRRELEIELYEIEAESLTGRRIDLSEG